MSYSRCRPARAALALGAALALLALPARARAYYTLAPAPALDYEVPPTLATALDNTGVGDLAVDFGPWGFSFPYYGETFTSITISVNGFVVLGRGPAQSRTARTLTVSQFDAPPGENVVLDHVIAPWLDDWTTVPGPAAGAAVPHVRFGFGRQSFLVAWDGVRRAGDGTFGTYQFELKLFSTGRFEFHYKRVAGDGGASCRTAFDCGQQGSSGYRHAASTVGETVHFRAPALRARAVARERPGKDVVYIRVVDTEGRPRPGVEMRLDWLVSGIPGSGPCVRVGDQSGLFPNAIHVSDPAHCATVQNAQVFSEGAGWARVVLPAGPPAPDLATLSVRLQARFDGMQFGGPFSVEQIVARAEHLGAYVYATQVVTPKATAVLSSDHAYSARACATVLDCPIGDDAGAARVAMGSDLEAPGHAYSASDQVALPDRGLAYGQCVAGRCAFRSRLEVWQGGESLGDRIVLVVPGIDALNEDGPARYFKLLNATPQAFEDGEQRLLSRLLAAGYDVMIGDWGDGRRTMEQLDVEVADWIRTASTLSTRPDRRIQVVGISQGGLNVRSALVRFPDVQSHVQSWFALDSPLRGANLGDASQGIQTLLHCASRGSADWYRANSPSAAQILADRADPDDCSCDGWAEDFSCARDNAPADAFFQSLQRAGRPPASIPSYAVANGAGLELRSNTTDARAELFHFHYEPGSDGSWSVGSRDCLPGSLYLTPADLHEPPTSIGFGAIAEGALESTGLAAVATQIGQAGIGPLATSFLDGMFKRLANLFSIELEVTYRATPAFIPVHSALDARGDFANCKSANGGYVVDRLVSDGQRWTETATNYQNWPHCTVNGFLSCKVEGWLRQQGEGRVPQGCNSLLSAPATMPNVRCAE